ncbi:hypothetical protein DLM46_17705 [Paraburkholderia lacunae]|uniref:Uncharacterized protein n=1 Tax=Paraburkholderia lacunae TaxID=2211104 RepID=A0A370N7V6_9BURK|nr:hypothetical protein DLM46_17705 [Paraburkholderia lacunae]
MAAAIDGIVRPPILPVPSRQIQEALYNSAPGASFPARPGRSAGRPRVVRVLCRVPDPAVEPERKAGAFSPRI